MTDHTPSPHSVVDGDRVLDAAAAYLKQQYGASHGLDHPTDRERILSSIPPAPAPSSLAGGEVSRAVDHLTNRLNKHGAFHLSDQTSIRAILAALSPEAPARVGGEIGEEFDNAAHCVTLAECPPGLFLWNGTLGFKSEYGAMEPDDATNGKHWKVGNRADAYCADSGEYFWGGTSTHDDRAKVLVYPIDAGTVAMVASHGPAALTPRHEAPASEGERLRMAYKTGYAEGVEDSNGMFDRDSCEEGWGQYAEKLSAQPALPARLPLPTVDDGRGGRRPINPQDDR